ncbi:glycerophosphodiester phosphodiesterase [Pacificimonas aurantium]|nr:MULTISPECIES: glycerophosphodiester phosphodiesterase [Pacificimonas]MBZ6377987.1 glycerophosphodiester phosphodiesterase [Pacificimonas aurantium]
MTSPETGMSQPPADQVLVIAHRGASGERPEHTLAAYELAIRQGADFIEPDLVSTKDGVLVARHENEISGTTDVAEHPEFADRRTEKTIDGEMVQGWFTEDFTLAELKTLRAKERLPQLRSTAFDGRFEVPTLAEVISLAKEHGVGIYPETKHPSYFRSVGLPLEEPLIAALEQAGWSHADAPVFIQSFEVENLRRLRAMTGARLVQLVGDPRSSRPVDASGITYGDMLTQEGLLAVAEYAAGLGPNKELVIREGAPTGLIDAAHAAGLAVHPWTYRRENVFLPPEYRRERDGREIGDLAGEICAAIAAGVDGVFSDNPKEAVAARESC